MKQLLCLFLLTGVSTFASDWPTFHGPLRDNISRETGLLKQWPEGGPKLLWKFSGCGHGYATVSIANGMIFTSGDFDQQEKITALSMDGQLKWQTPHGKSWQGAQPGSRTTPTYDDGMLYHLAPHGSLSAFDAATGKIAWALNIKEKFGATSGGWGFAENLLVEGDKVFCMPGGPEGRIVALDKKTGKTVWSNTEVTDGKAYSSPITANHGGVHQLIALGHSAVFGIDTRTGKLLWSHEHPSTCDQNVTSPIYHQGKVFVTSGHKAGGRVFTVSEDNRSTSQLWYGTRLDNCHGGVVLIDGYLYGSGCRMYNKGLLCVEFATGKVMYQAREIGKVSITWADGMLYCLGNDGEMLLVKPTPEAATVVSHFRIPNAAREHTLTHPVVFGGRLYLRHLDDLFVYDIRDSGR